MCRASFYFHHACGCAPTGPGDWRNFCHNPSTCISSVRRVRSSDEHLILAAVGSSWHTFHTKRPSCGGSTCGVAFSVVSETFCCIRDREICMQLASLPPTAMMILHWKLRSAFSFDFSSAAEWSRLPFPCILASAIWTRSHLEMIWNIYCMLYDFRRAVDCGCVRVISMPMIAKIVPHKSDRHTVWRCDCYCIHYHGRSAVLLCVWTVCSGYWMSSRMHHIWKVETNIINNNQLIVQKMPSLTTKSRAIYYAHAIHCC